MIDASRPRSNEWFPAELEQKFPRKIRLAAIGVYYLVGSMVVSMFMLAFVVADVSMTGKVAENGKRLARDGRLAYTADVQAGGMHSATVSYSFTYNENLYRGRATLPKRYLNQISGYSKAGNFPILFLPRDPSINHPSDWQDDESYSFLSYVLSVITIIQWSVLIKVLLGDLRLAQSGIAAIGRVTQCSRGKNGGIYLKYEFRDSDDLLVEGTGEHPMPLDQDTQICILYLPDESQKSRPYPLVFFRAVK